MAFKFEKLRIWHDAVELSNAIDLLVKSFPPGERLNISSQLKRAADSVALNIAEGCTGQSSLEFRRFLNIALLSAIEVVSGLYISKMRGYVSQEKYNQLYEDYEALVKKITSFKIYLQSNKVDKLN